MIPASEASSSPRTLPMQATPTLAAETQPAFPPPRGWTALSPRHPANPPLHQATNKRPLPNYLENSVSTTSSPGS